MKKLHVSSKGISIIGAIFTLIILGIFGGAIVVLVSAGHESRFGQLSREWAFYDVQAGLEYALREIDVGGYPLVTNKVFGQGNFTIGIEYNEGNLHHITATALVGEVQKSHRISYDSFEADCFFVDYSSVSLAGSGNNDLTGMTVRKVCNEGVNIDKIYLNWDPDDNEKVVLISINSTVVWEDIIGLPADSTVDIEDTLLTASAAYPVTLIRFTSNMSGKTVTLKYIMTDSSTETISFPLP